ncbi:hypothetical protein MMC13_000582 [Lambiella insularis]|nr:hypothetical protein [Lambiella insularis]
MDPSPAQSYLRSLLNRILHVYTTDARMFVGEFKCTDNESNIILSSAHEYRIPPPPSPSTLPATASTTVLSPPLQPRYVGLIVVPGLYVTKIEVEGALDAGVDRAEAMRRKERALVPGGGVRVEEEKGGE